VRPRPPWMEIVETTLSCVALVSLLLPWFTDCVTFEVTDGQHPRFIPVPVPALETWAGWGVAIFDGLVLVLALACHGKQSWRTHCWLAASAILVLVVEALARVLMARPDLEMRMQALGPRFDWSCLRWELALPVMANAGLLILCRLRRGVVATVATPTAHNGSGAPPQ
jgi:hypothetical protein